MSSEVKRGGVFSATTPRLALLRADCDGSSKSRRQSRAVCDFVALKRLQQVFEPDEVTDQRV